MELLGDQKEVLLNTLEDRVDEEGVLHIRIDKQKAYLGEVELADRDAIVFKAKIVTYPSKREKVLEAARELIERGY
jgi:RNA binding exosome subunit